MDSQKILDDPKAYDEFLSKFFNKYDKESKGYISIEDMEQVINDVNEEIKNSYEIWFLPINELYFNELDKNKDGKISKEEFSYHVNKLLLKRAAKEKTEFLNLKCWESAKDCVRVKIAQLKLFVENEKEGLNCQLLEIPIEKYEEEILRWEEELRKLEADVNYQIPNFLERY